MDCHVQQVTDTRSSSGDTFRLRIIPASSTTTTMNSTSLSITRWRKSSILTVNSVGGFSLRNSQWWHTEPLRSSISLKPPADWTTLLKNTRAHPSLKDYIGHVSLALRGIAQPVNLPTLTNCLGYIRDCVNMIIWEFISWLGCPFSPLYLFHSPFAPFPIPPIPIPLNPARSLGEDCELP